MKTHALLLGCAAGALIAAPGHAQTAGTPTQQATGATPADTSTSAAATEAAATQDDQGQTTDTNGGRGARVEEREVVVTGSRFQKLLDQPQSKSVINAEDRNLAGVGDVRQLIQVQPGFNYTPEYGLNVRGVGRQTAQSILGAENTVVQYVDGFIALDPINIAESTLFGGNVQFIRGPAGTLYGRNSLAGSVNLISRAPTKEFTGEVQAGVGRGGYYTVGANIAGPITDTIGFRAGLQQFESPSLATNFGTTLDSKKAGFAVKNLYFEFQLEGRFGPLHIRNRVTHFETDNQPGYASFDRYSNNLPSGRPAQAFTFPTINAQYGYDGRAPSGRLQTNVNFAGYDRLRNNFVDILNADLDLGFASLVYVGGYDRYSTYGSSDYDQTSRTSYDSSTVTPPAAPVPDFGFLGFPPNTIVPTDIRANYDNRDHYWSQEARLESKPGGALNWVLGGYYLNQHFNERYFINIPNAGAPLATPQSSYTTAPGSGAPNPDKAIYDQRNLFDIRTTAAFGNIVWDLTSAFRLDAGVRYTWDEKAATTAFRSVYYYPLSPTLPDVAAYTDPGQGANTFRRDQGLSGRAALAWRPSAGDQIYIAYQRGYQASALTLGQGLPPNNIARPEHLDVYEVGGFGTLGRVRLDASVFYQNFFDQQIPITTRGTIATPGGGTAPGPLFTTFTNAPLSRIYGTEAQLTWRPNDHSNIVASYTYLHPTFERFSGVIDIAQGCSTAPLAAGQQCTTPAAAGYVAPTNPLYQAPQNLSGNDIPRTPRNKATLYGFYGIDLGSFGYLYPGGSFTYQSSYNYSPFNTAATRIPGRTLVGLTLTYRTAGEHLDITGSVTNLFDNKYYDFRTPTDQGTTFVSYVTGYGAPRFWTVTGRYRF